jgi:hypothetical protein
VTPQPIPAKQALEAGDVEFLREYAAKLERTGYPIHAQVIHRAIAELDRAERLKAALERMATFDGYVASLARDVLRSAQEPVA